MLKQMQTQRRADSRPPLPHQDEFPAEYGHEAVTASQRFLGRLLSSRAGLRFLCYAHPQPNIHRWLLFFSQRQLSPNSTVSSHDAGQAPSPSRASLRQARIRLKGPLTPGKKPPALDPDTAPPSGSKMRVKDLPESPRLLVRIN